MNTFRKAAVALSSALTFSLAVAPAVRADALDDELTAIKNLLITGKDDDAAQRLDTLEARARILASSTPSDAHVQYILGMAAMYAGHDAPAVNALGQALKLDPKNAQYVLGRGQLALYQSKPKEAVTVLAKFVQQDDKNVEVWAMLGEAQAADEQFAAAQDNYLRAAVLAPKESKYVIAIGQMLAKQHKNAEALTIFQNALEMDPKNGSILGNMAQVYEAQKELDKALEVYAKMVALNATDYRALAKEVQLYQAQGKAKERDAARDQIVALKKAGKIDADSFCREQFIQGQSNVIVLEYFEIKGSAAVRYAFNVLAADGKSVDKRITLASSPEVNALARDQGRIKGDERMYHLDVYTIKDGEVANRQAYSLFTKEPTYDETRDLVKQYFAGTLKPVTNDPRDGMQIGGPR